MDAGATCSIRSVRPQDLDGLIVLCEQHAAYEGVAYDQRNKPEQLFHALFAAEPRVYAWVV